MSDTISRTAACQYLGVSETALARAVEAGHLAVDEAGRVESESIARLLGLGPEEVVDDEPEVGAPSAPVGRAQRVNLRTRLPPTVHVGNAWTREQVERELREMARALPDGAEYCVSIGGPLELDDGRVLRRGEVVPSDAKARTEAKPRRGGGPERPHPFLSPEHLADAGYVLRRRDWA